MTILDQLFSALGQVLTVFLLGSIFFGLGRFFYRKKPNKRPFLDFFSLSFSKIQFDKTFLFIWLGFIVFGVISTTIQFHETSEQTGFQSRQYGSSFIILVDASTYI